MGFFGELKQDLSQVAGDELKREKADAEAERILADAELAGLDEAESIAMRSSRGDDLPGDDNDDVAALLKDLVAGLGSEDEIAPESVDHSSDISDDINSILAGLSTDFPSEGASADNEVQTESADREVPGSSESEGTEQSGDINEAFNLAIASLKKAEEKASEEAEEAVKGAETENAAGTYETAAESEVAENAAAEGYKPAAEAAENTAVEVYASAAKTATETITENEDGNYEAAEAEIKNESDFSPEEIADSVAAESGAAGSVDKEASGADAAETGVSEASEVDAAGTGSKAAQSEEIHTAVKTDPKEVFKMEEGTFSEETSVITEGMVINGNIESAGNLDIMGKVNGDVTVRGKLNVTGFITGNSTAKEIYAENARIIGNVNSESSVKIGAGTVVVGNIYAFGAAIAGAVKGDIDVHGPVILDSSAIVKGNIRSKSVQINNGAALEGVCSQAYAEVSPTAFFDDFKADGND